MRKTLFLRIFLGSVTVIALLAGFIAVLAPRAMRAHHIQERSTDLEHLALVLEDRIAPYLAGQGDGDLGDLIVRTARRTGSRITVVDAAGNVLADSEGMVRDMENHQWRPEVQASLRGERTMSIRPSSTLKTDMMYLSVPLRSDARIVGALRLGLFMRDFDALMAQLRADLTKVIAAVTLIALALAFFLARSVSRPLKDVLEASARVSSGDFEARVRSRRGGELRDLAQGFNAMTARLKATFEELNEKTEEIEGILGSIREGLGVLDADSRIVLCNEGFRRLIGNEAPLGRHIWEAVRSSSLIEAVRDVRTSPAGVGREVTIGDRRLLTSVVPLAGGGRVIITLRDVTGLLPADRG